MPLMIDSAGQPDLVDEVVGTFRPVLRLCIDLCVSLEPADGRLHLGPHRSLVRTPRQAAAPARAIPGPRRIR
ncbi:hypothetical protein [Streptomyces sp. NRRL B-24085]|uniref:hypothetical protein n=1 Tax=Streptomyces sp. NRRL B-24085 TaxID=1709476 RepID=UPI0006B389C7|nr:hypothetical protein [Streptomyces sp. NRRL B-24085]